MPFDPGKEGPPIDAARWRPNAELRALALRRCSWVNNDEMNDIPDAEEWTRTLLISAYYQGLADGVRHMGRKSGHKHSFKEVGHNE